MNQLNPRELANWLAATDRTKPVLLDVREPWEFQVCHIEDSVHIPMSAVPTNFDSLDSNAAIVVICHHGARSLQVANFLQSNGFENLYNLNGGVAAWAQVVDPTMPTY